MHYSYKMIEKEYKIKVIKNSVDAFKIRKNSDDHFYLIYLVLSNIK